MSAGALASIDEHADELERAYRLPQRAPRPPMRAASSFSFGSLSPARNSPLAISSRIPSMAWSVAAV